MQGRRHRIRLLLGAMLFGVVGPTAPGLACGYHGGLGNGLAPAHPRSIEVAIAVRESLDRQVIDAAPPLPALVQFARVGRLLEQLRQRLAVGGSLAPPLPPMALVLVESRLWARYEMQDGKFSLEPHVPGPKIDDVVVLTGESVLKGLIDGGLSPERAIAEGILVVSGPSSSGAIMEDALRRAFVSSKSAPSTANRAVH